jgi:hypothetical protein
MALVAETAEGLEAAQRIVNSASPSLNKSTS